MQKHTAQKKRRPRIIARNGVIKAQLDNGLTVLLKEAHNAPVVTFWCWYRVGSRMERRGVTGASHWVEHMLFKGTPQFPRSMADKAIAREGGLFNGFTWLDFTTYFETLPADKWELGAQIEADRMCHALFAPKEVSAERTVIISERQGAENSPMFLLNEEVQAAAFRVHPYRHDTIGDMSDLLTMTRDDLYAHYRTYYVPDNAVAVAVGDFEAGDALKLIAKHFGRIKPGPGVKPAAVLEPPQRGERRVQVEGPGSTAYVELAYRAPQAGHADFPAIVVLDAILSGASSLAGAGGGSNASSRLYRALVDTELAIDVSGALTPTVDPFVYVITATVRTGRAPAEVEAALDAELARIAEQPVSEAEIAKAIKQAQAIFAYGAESVTNQGFWYGFAEIFDSYAWFETYLDRLAAVSVDDVQRVAREYLARQRRTVGWYIPTNGQRPTTQSGAQL